MFYDRKIKYLHMYENQEKLQNAGFVKLEAAGEKVGIQLHITGLHQMDSAKGTVVFVGNGREELLGEVYIEQGKGVFQRSGLCKERLVDDMDYDALEEVCVVLPRDMVLRCIIQERSRADVIEAEEEGELLREAFDGEMLTAEATVEQDMNTPEEFWEENPTRQEHKQEREPVQDEPEIFAADKWQQLWALYPHIRPFGDSREYLVIKPRDFVVLQKEHFGLSSNSFLLHGYYNYQHLILCRITKREGECFYVGVPGNFYDKEKQVAVMFGFESFEGVQEPAVNGDFGYYMVRVTI